MPVLLADLSKAVLSGSRPMTPPRSRSARFHKALWECLTSSQVWVFLLLFFLGGGGGEGCFYAVLLNFEGWFARCEYMYITYLRLFSYLKRCCLWDGGGNETRESTLSSKLCRGQA